MDQELKNAIYHLYEWDYRYGDHFGVKLFDLIAKADGANRERIREGFPKYVEAFELYQREGSEVYSRIGK